MADKPEAMRRSRPSRLWVDRLFKIPGRSGAPGIGPNEGARATPIAYRRPRRIEMIGVFSNTRHVYSPRNLRTTLNGA
jgi:hypothetical protein